MTDPEERIVRHYGGTGLYRRIVEALARAGVDEKAVSVDDLKPVDEFHIGGVAATEALLDPLGIEPGMRVLDIGSGIGGPARWMRSRYGAAVTGVDLTPEFVATAKRLTDLVGLDARFVVGSALDLPFEDASFDIASLIHVGMNLPDKPRLFSQVARVLAPQGTFAVYDVMRFGEHPAFPLPWATSSGESFLERPDTYLSAAEAAGFTLTLRRDRGEIARDFFRKMQEAIADGGPPAVGLPILMGSNAGEKVANMIAAVNAGDIQPVEMVFRKG